MTAVSDDKGSDMTITNNTPVDVTAIGALMEVDTVDANLARLILMHLKRLPFAERLDLLPGLLGVEAQVLLATMGQPGPVHYHIADLTEPAGPMMFNGASPHALGAIESVQPPHLIRKVWQATVGRRSSYSYKIEVFRIGGAICGPMNGEPVAVVTFNADGSPVEGERSWAMNYNAERAICDLFAALCR